MSVSHDDAINILRNAGPAVTLSVMHYRSAAPFLLKNLRQLVPETCEATAADAAAAAAAAEAEEQRRTGTSMRVLLLNVVPYTIRLNGMP